MPVKLSPEDRTKIRALRDDGWSLAAIAKLYGVHGTTIYRVVGRGTVERLNVTLDGRRHPGRLELPAKKCVWCERMHFGTHEYCSASCRRQRRRLREYEAGRLPSARRTLTP